MSTPRQFLFWGQDLSGYVLDWGTIEEVKTILMAKAEMFVGELDLTVNNAANIFSDNATGALFAGYDWFNEIGTVNLNGAPVFMGLLKDIEIDGETRQAVLHFENFFSLPSETAITQVISAANPAATILGMLQAINLNNAFAPYINLPSFSSAAGLTAGMLVSINPSSGNNTTVLSMIQSISELCGMAVYVNQGLITCTAFKPWQGGNLGPALQAGNGVRAFKIKNTAYQALSNSVSVNYGASGTYSATNPQSINLYGTTKSKQFSTATSSELSVPTLSAAQVIAANYLAVTSNLRDQCTLDLDSATWPTLQLGDRFPITCPRWGYNNRPFEVIEVHKTLQDTTIEAVLASLA